MWICCALSLSIPCVLNALSHLNHQTSCGAIHIPCLLGLGNPSGREISNWWCQDSGTALGPTPLTTVPCCWYRTQR